LQRITGVITFIFVAWHVYETRIQVALGNVSHEDLGNHMNNIVSDPVVFGVYIVAVIAATFHFSNGIWAFLVSWGVTVGPRAQKVSSNICMVIFVLISALFILSLFAFRSDEFASAATAALSSVSVG
jgi:succinate dehydrogenase / fumarate reductase cytochrome b subunit